MKASEAPALPPAASLAGSRRPGVAVLVYTAGYGGIETIVINWAKALEGSGFRIHLFMFEQPEGPRSRFLTLATASGLVVRQIPWSRRKPLIRAARSMAAYIRDLDIDILHCHNPYADFVGALVKRYVNVTTVNTFHAWGESGLRVRILEKLDVIVSRFFDKITAASEAARRGAEERGIPAERIRVLRVSVADSAIRLSPTERDSRRRALGASPEDLVFVSLARFYRVKRYDVMLRAIAEIARSFPGVRLWTAGDGPEEPGMRQLSVKLGVAEKVRFLGYRDDIPQILAMADCLMLTSDIEGLPLAVIEAMMAGRPIVATKVGSIPEVLRHGQSALLVNPGCPSEVAQAGLELAGDPTKREILGHEARRVYEESFSPEAAAVILTRFYEDIVSS